jgi:thiol-disulfide isomerase/thioredoxin
MKNTLFLVLLVFAFASCQQKTAENTTPEAETSTTPTPEVVEEIKPIGLTGVYENFADIEHLFSTESDSVYVVNFWATWCKPCVAELPYFEKLNEEYRGKKMKMLLVSLDFKRQIDSKLKPFIIKRELKPEVVALIDSNSNDWIPKVSPMWSGAIPATLIFNKDKRGFYEQSFEYEELEKTLKEYLE